MLNKHISLSFFVIHYHLLSLLLITANNYQRPKLLIRANLSADIYTLFVSMSAQYYVTY